MPSTTPPTVSRPNSIGMPNMASTSDFRAEKLFKEALRSIHAGFLFEPACEKTSEKVRASGQHEPVAADKLGYLT